MDGVGEIIGGFAELAFASTTDRNGKNNGWVCLFITLLILGIVGYCVYLGMKEEPVVKQKQECGQVILKLGNNEVVVLINGEKVVKTISKELYINKKESDEICFEK